MDNFISYIQDPVVLAYIAIFGLAGTIISIILAIYFYFHPKKGKRELIICEVSKRLNIGKGSQTFFQNFHVLINEEEIKEDVFYIEGGFTNKNDFDIETKEGYQNIDFIFPPSCKIKAVKISEASDDQFLVKLKKLNNFDNLEANPKNIIPFIIPPQFRANDKARFSALIIGPKFLFHQVRYKTNISNVKAIDQRVLDRPSIFTLFICIILNLIIIFLLAMHLFYNDNKLYEILAVICLVIFLGIIFSNKHFRKILLIID